MTNANDFMAAYAQHRASLSEVNTFNKSAVFDALAKAAISRVTVTFNGEGDSGQIEDISTDDDKEIPSVLVETKHTSWGAKEIEIGSTSLRDAIETLCYDYLEQEHGGWENNDGAYGEFTFNVPEKLLELEFSGRYTEVHTTTHTF
jgi:hypothetical protein